jgi:chemotaxis protein MotB
VARRKTEEEPENHERWLVSYADFITLLFAFFVVMYAVSRVDRQRVVEVQAAIKWALHYEGTGGIGQMPIFEGPPSEGGCVANLGGGRRVTPEEKHAFEVIRRRLDRRLRPFLVEQLAGPAGVIIEIDRKRLVIRLSSARFFDPGEAALRPDALPVIDAIISELKPMKRHIRVEGHTDDRPLVAGRYRDNWELSTSRAATVTAYIEQAHKVRGDMLAAVGFAATRPISPNDTVAGREINRRVDMVVEMGAGDPLTAVVH